MRKRSNSRSSSSRRRGRLRRRRTPTSPSGTCLLSFCTPMQTARESRLRIQKPSSATLPRSCPRSLRVFLRMRRSSGRISLRRTRRGTRGRWKTTSLPAMTARMTVSARRRRRRRTPMPPSAIRRRSSSTPTCTVRPSRRPTPKQASETLPRSSPSFSRPCPRRNARSTTSLRWRTRRVTSARWLPTKEAPLELGTILSLTLETMPTYLFIFDFYVVG
mmetsp:Transcript_7949/g.18815  ORF Transcript_7949/g.18815 Transcript_7949/m.18815 type:complete len:218 (+) Transcript_7949:97-750(+)